LQVHVDLVSRYQNCQDAEDQGKLELQLEDQFDAGLVAVGEAIGRQWELRRGSLHKQYSIRILKLKLG